MALDYLAVAVCNHHESGDFSMVHNPLVMLASVFDRFGRYLPAATIAGFAAVNPMTWAGFPEPDTVITHLREVLGDKTYDALARKGETMTTAEMVTYAYDQIDHARAELNAVLE